MEIYIPIWLDLLFDISQEHVFTAEDLHSNMVRFIMFDLTVINKPVEEFTFQYG